LLALNTFKSIKLIFKWVANKNLERSMKKLVFVLLFVVFASWSVWAQGFYVDGGLGFGLSRMIAIDSGLQNNDGGG
jgi:hypothetical protein